MKHKGKGFTLTELLVVVVILGIISAISIPMIRNAQMRNENRKYINYLESLKYSAKLYVDSYSDDLFGNEKSGCAIITFEDLKTKTLLKDIDIDNISCNSDDTFVRVVKINDRYGYSANIGCGKESGGTVHVTKRFPEVAVSKTNCSIDSDVLMTINASPTQSSSNDVKRKKMKVTINSTTGMNQQPLIFYGFNTTGNNTIDGEWQPLPITLPTESDQISTVESGNTVSVISDEILTPEGVTGDYYLMIRVDRLQDLVGRDWKKDLSNPYVKTGPYRVDNTKPIITKLEAKSTTTEYNNLKVKLTYAVNDTYYTPSNEIKVCFSESKAECSSFGSNSSPTNYTVSGDYDGKTRTIYIHAKDKAGNIGVSSVDYTVYEKCSETKSDEKWSDTTECSKKCGTGKKQQESGSVDVYLEVTCSKKHTQEVNCNTMDCCSRVKYVDGSNCSAKCGGGTYNQLAYSYYDNSRCLGKDKTSGGSACNEFSCCSNVYYKNGTKCSAKCGGGTYNRLAYSSYTNKRCPSEDKSSGGNACNTQDCCKNSEEVPGEWSNWSTCTKKCGGGTQTRTRTITIKSKDDGSVCGTKEEEQSQSCNSELCCRNGYIRYKDGNTCTVECGGGTYNQMAYSTIDGSRCPTFDKTSGGSTCNTTKCPTAPTCSISVTNGAERNNGWYKSDVEIKMTINGTVTAYGLNTSKKSTNKITSYLLSQEGTHKYYGYVKNAGGESSCSKEINIDKNPPYIESIAKVDGDPWPDNGKDEKHWLRVKITDKLSGLHYRRVELTDNKTEVVEGYYAGFPNSFSEGLATGCHFLNYNFTSICDRAGNCTSKKGEVLFTPQGGC